MSPFLLAAAAALVIVVATAAFVLVRRARPAEGEREGQEEDNDVVLQRSGLAVALAHSGFTRVRPRHFVRGRFEIGVVVTRSPEPVVERVDVRALAAEHHTLSLEPDFVARATPGENRAPRIGTHVEVREGKGMAHRDAAPEDHERFARVVSARIDRLDALAWTALEVFNHKVPRVHIYFVPSIAHGVGGQLQRALQEAESVVDELTARGAAD